jgi:hypothetical protein
MINTVPFQQATESSKQQSPPNSNSKVSLGAHSPSTLIIHTSLRPFITPVDHFSDTLISFAMAPFVQTLLSILIATAALQPALAAPVAKSSGLVARQLAGEGAAADSILTDTDNGVGYGTENAEDNTASLINSAKGSVPNAPATPATRRRRQLAGEGAAANSILSDTDNGIGYGIENAEDNTASLITSAKGSTSASPVTRRQLDKIANGAGAVLDAAGAPAAANVVTSNGDSVDGTLTSDAADAGASVGSAEESALESAGSAVPKAKRQADKIANGAANVITAAGQPGVAGQVQSSGDTVDGQATSDAANAGAQVGSDVETTLEQAGSDTPSSVPSVSTK